MVKREPPLIRAGYPERIEGIRFASGCKWRSLEWQWEWWRGRGSWWRIVHIAVRPDPYSMPLYIFNRCPMGTREKPVAWTLFGMRFKGRFKKLQTA